MSLLDLILSLVRKKIPQCLVSADNILHKESPALGQGGDDARGCFPTGHPVCSAFKEIKTYHALDYFWFQKASLSFCSRLQIC